MPFLCAFILWFLQNEKHDTSCSIYLYLIFRNRRPQIWRLFLNRFSFIYCLLQYIHDRIYKGSLTHVYQFVDETGNITQTYTLYVYEKTNLPARYDMHGYNNIQWAPYDKYILEYDQWLERFPLDIFTRPMKGLLIEVFI